MDELFRYIKTCRNSGFSDEKITQALLDQGWVKTQIDLAYAGLIPADSTQKSSRLAWIFPIICFLLVAVVSVIWAIKALQ